MNDTLLPCPHCGRDERSICLSVSKPTAKGKCRTYRVGCSNCYAQTQQAYTAEEAIAAWNRRTPTATCPPPTDLSFLSGLLVEYHVPHDGTGDGMRDALREWMIQHRDRATCPTCDGLRAEIDRYHRAAAECRKLVANGGAPPNESQLARADVILREIAGCPPAPCATQENAQPTPGVYTSSAVVPQSYVPQPPPAPPVERQAWPVGDGVFGLYLVVPSEADAAGFVRAVVGVAANGWTCVGFAFTDTERDAMVAGSLDGAPTEPWWVPVNGDGTPARWAIMVRRNADPHASGVSAANDR